MSRIRPDVDSRNAADEIKRFLDSKKFDLVDYSYVNIEAYPPPNDDDYPELKRFSAQWAAFFDEADKVLNNPDIIEEPGQSSFIEVLGKYSPTMAQDLAEFDDATSHVAELVNTDQEYWSNLRQIILPLYEKSPYYNEWKGNRWKAISLSYDPTPLEVRTTQMWTNKETGERIRGELLRTTEYPAGFILKVL